MLNRFLVILLLISVQAIGQPIYFDGSESLQAIIDSAPDYTEIICDLNDTIAVKETIVVNKPLTVRGLHAILPDSIGDVPILQANAAGFIFTDFALHGNAQTVSQENRAPLLVVKGDNFAIERGQFFHSSKEGVSVEADTSDLAGGTIRDIYGYGIMRDLVSLNGGYGGKKVRNILVENIRCDSCVLRGAVEVSNGTDNITVRKVYANQSAYAVDVQDHRREFQVNQNIVLEDIFAIDCKMGLRTANADYGHHNLSVRNITAIRCDWPIDISHTSQVTLENVIIQGHASEKNSPVKIENCHGVTVENVKIINTTFAGPALHIINSSKMLVNGLIIGGNNPALTNPVIYEINDGNKYQGLILNNVIASEGLKGGILFKANDSAGNLSKAKVSNSLVSVDNQAGFDEIEIK